MSNFNLLPSSSSALDTGVKIATITIALVNIFIGWRVFILNKRKDNRFKAEDRVEKEKDRKAQLLKTLVLDHSLSQFYKSFEELDILSNPLLDRTITQEQKVEIDSQMKDQFTTLRRKVYDPLIAIDLALYNKILEISDKLQDELSESIFNDGVNLSHQPMFEDLITNKFIHTKAEIIKILYEYRG